MSAVRGKTEVIRAGGDFRFWHLSDMPTGLRNVRFCGQSRSDQIRRQLPFWTCNGNTCGAA